MDRLRELRSHVVEVDALSTQSSTRTPLLNESDTAPLYTEPEQAHYATYLAEVKSVSGELEKVEEELNSLDEKFRSEPTSVNRKEMGERKKLRNQHFQSIGSSFSRINTRIQKLQGMCSQGEARFSPGEQKIMLNTYNSVSIKFSELLKRYNQIMNNMKSRDSEALRRQVKFSNPKFSEDEVEQFVEKVEQGKIDQAALFEIQERHDDILEIERRLLELVQLIRDIDSKIVEQGAQLDSIEHNVLSADAYVEDGVENLDRALVYRNSRRKKMAVCLCILIIVALGLALGLTLG